MTKNQNLLPFLNIFKSLGKGKDQKELFKKSYTYYYGSQDEMDFISYAGLLEQSSYLKINDRFTRILFVSGYPFVASTGWLNMLINFNHDIDISYHIEQVDPVSALPKLNRKITELESVRRGMQREGKVIGSELTDPLESAVELKNKIQRGQEKLFQVSIYMAISSKTLTELNKLTALVETVMSTRLFYTKTAIFQQLEGLQSILPRAENLLAQKRNLDSSSAALTFPFVSSEFVQESGILYGINKSNNSLVIVDRFSLTNANCIIFAQSGSGKSFTSKVEILRQLMRGTHTIVIDPEREYQQLTKSVKGTYIHLATKSKEKINPFDFSIHSYNNENNLAEHIQDLTEIISLMAGGLNSEERADVDKALVETYKLHGFTLSGTQIQNQPPLLKDFYHVLKSRRKRNLCARLEKYVSGSLSGVFDSHTNIILTNRLVVFDIKDLPESLRQIMILAVANFVQAQVKSDPRKRILVIDEGWMLLQHEESARFIAGLVRRARKHYLGVTIITQQANDFLNSDYGRAIASQSAMRILMKQDTTTIKKVVEEFHLSGYEERFLVTCDKGEAILIADQNHVALKIVASQKEHPILTTDPREVFDPS